MKKIILYFIILVVFCFVSAPNIVATAHPGSLDENGGHYDRSNGTYHYHDGSSPDRDGNSSSGDSIYAFIVCIVCVGVFIIIAKKSL